MKSKFEHIVKNQLEDRELPVSDNAWERLQEMMALPEVSTKKTPRMKIWLPMSIAASVVLFIGLYLGWNSFSTKESPTVATQTKNKEILQTVQEQENISSIPVQEDLLADSSVQQKQIGTKNTEIVPSYAHKNVEFLETEIVSNSEVNLEFESEKASITQILPEPQTELAHQEEIQLEEKKKANFVDPEMLLYSIENNEAVKQSKSNSRLVLIDFNK